MCDTYTWQRRSLFIRGKPILSSEKLIYKDYERKVSVGKKTLVVNLKGLGVKTNWLAVNHQPESNTASDSELVSRESEVGVGG
jgi:hypothetical protein